MSTEQKIIDQVRARIPAFGRVDEEMNRQIAKFGLQEHSREWWFAILGEEFGEVGKAMLEKHFNYEGAKDNYREELIQVAAVAISALLCDERTKSEVVPK